MITFLETPVLMTLWIPYMKEQIFINTRCSSINKKYIGRTFANLLEIFVIKKKTTPIS